MSELSNLELYRRLELSLLATRQYGKPDEDMVLDAMDLMWSRLTDEERALLNREVPNCWPTLPGMSDVRCFFLTPTNRYQVSLRRYGRNISTDGGYEAAKCPLPHGYHTASVDVEIVVLDEQPIGTTQPGTPDSYPTDPRWPTCCPCGYVFEGADMWQVNHHQIHERSDGGEPCTLQKAPPGALWDAHWYGDKKGPDGLNLVVRLPNGADWHIDGPSYNAGKPGSGWTRTGQVPNITATPSILMRDYHGWLRDGILVPC
jgi:hypothetical protein